MFGVNINSYIRKENKIMEKFISVSLIAIDEKGFTRKFIKDREVSILDSVVFKREIAEKIMKFAQKNFDRSKEFERGENCRNKDKTTRNYCFLQKHKIEKVKKKAVKLLFELLRSQEEAKNEDDEELIALSTMISYIDIIQQSKEKLYLEVENTDGTDLFEISKSKSKENKEKDNEDDDDLL